jgi:hypothetical protein
VWRLTGKKPQQLADAPELPASVVAVWQYFLSVNAERGNGMNGPEKLTAQNLRDWMWLNGVPHLELWERRALMAVDRLWLAQQNKPKGAP